MARGGRRTGAGRKPGPRRAPVVGMDGLPRRPRVELPPAPPLAAQVALLEPPADLSEDAQFCWKAWAPTVLEERTLTPSTVAGFRELCGRMALVRALDARIAVLGPATQEAFPYLKERRGQAVQLASSLKDFKLTAFGKPVTSDKPKATAPNPWQQIVGR
jgi:hypothetical protein